MWFGSVGVHSRWSEPPHGPRGNVMRDNREPEKRAVERAERDVSDVSHVVFRLQDIETGMQINESLTDCEKKRIPQDLASFHSILESSI